jgi:hypothetical protein
MEIPGIIIFLCMAGYKNPLQTNDIWCLMGGNPATLYDGYLQFILWTAG